MRIRSFIIAYALVLAILLFADRRPGHSQQDRYSHVVDLTDGDTTTSPHAITGSMAPAVAIAAMRMRTTTTTTTTNTTATKNGDSRTRIIAPDALIPGTWTAAQIPPERLVAPLVVMDLNASAGNQPISLDDISAWEARNGMIPQGAVVAVRRPAAQSDSLTSTQFPVAREAAEFLVDARSTIGFAVETAVDFTADRTLARQLALHGSYVVEGASGFNALPATGSLVLVAPTKSKKSTNASVRVLAMVR
jgi:kynurenine formamidase